MGCPALGPPPPGPGPPSPPPPPRMPPPPPPPNSWPEVELRAGRFLGLYITVVTYLERYLQYQGCGTMFAVPCLRYMVVVQWETNAEAQDASARATALLRMGQPRCTAAHAARASPVRRAQHGGVDAGGGALQVDVVQDDVLRQSGHSAAERPAL